MDSLIDYPGVRVVRKELRDLNPFQLRELLWAFHQLKRSENAFTAAHLTAMAAARPNNMGLVAARAIDSKFADMAICHTGHCQHNNVSFLAWHRRFVALFEQILRKVYVTSYAEDPPADAGQYDPRTMALPYWNYIAPDAGEPLRLPQLFTDTADVATGRVGTPAIPNPLYHARTDADLDNLSAYLRGDCSFHIDEAMARPTYLDFQQTLDLGVHGSIHNATGGDMTIPATAAFDPMFWFHHSNIDRLWAEWHATHPAAGPSIIDVNAWLGDAAVHWEGLLDYPGFELYADGDVRRAQLLLAEVLDGTPGVRYGRPAAGAAGPRPRAGVTRFSMKLEHVAQIQGSYLLTVLALGPGDALPVTHEELRRGDFNKQTIATAGVFADAECECTPEQLAIKVDVPLVLDVTERFHTVMRDAAPKAYGWNGGEVLPNGYRVIIVATPPLQPVSESKGETSTAHGAAGAKAIPVDEGGTTLGDAGAHDTDSKADSRTPCHCTELPITAVKLKHGTVKAFPWQPVFGVRRSDDDVIRHGLYHQFLPLTASPPGQAPQQPAITAHFRREPTTPSTSDVAEEAETVVSSSAEAEAKVAADVPVNSFPMVKEWTKKGLHAMFGTRGAGVRIGVVDTGIDLTHDDLDRLHVQYRNPTATRLHWRDFSGDGAGAPRDYLGHGTITATILAGDSDGIAPDATLFVARAFSGNRDGSWNVIAESIRWLTKSSVHIIVLPLGSYSHHRGVTRAIYKAMADNIVVVAASGIDVRNDYQLHFDNADAPASGAMFPACLPGVISVAAAADSRYCARDAPRGRVTTESVLLGYQPGQRPSSIDVVAPGIASVGLIGDIRVAAGSSVATAHTAAVIALTLAAANKFHHSYDDRDVRAIAGAHEWLRFAGLANAARVPDKLLSPKMVLDSLIKQRKLLLPPMDRRGDQDVAKLLSAMQRLDVSEHGERLRPPVRRAAPATGAGGGAGGHAGAGGDTSGVMSRTHAPTLGEEYVFAHRAAWVRGQDTAPTAPLALKTAVSLAGMARVVPLSSFGTAKKLLRVMAKMLKPALRPGRGERRLELASLGEMLHLPDGPVATSRVLLALAHINNEVDSFATGSCLKRVSREWVHTRRVGRPRGMPRVFVEYKSVVVQIHLDDDRVMRSTLMQLVEASPP